MVNKIGVIGDTHFGSGYNMGSIDILTQLNTRLLDFANTFNKIVDKFLQEGVKTIVLTGDIFETRHPTASQYKIFSLCMQRAINLGFEIIIVVGNHDQQRHINTTTVDLFSSLKIQGIKVFSELGVHSINDNLHLILMPYRDRKMLKGDTNSEAIEKLKNELYAATEKLKGNKIIVGHFMLEKNDFTQDPDRFSLNELILPFKLFSDFDMVIMGHIHRHEVISTEKPIFIYSGSMEKTSFGEKDHNKVSLIIDPDNDNKVDIIPSEVRNLFELNFDYNGSEPFKEKINDKIIEDIEVISQSNDLRGSICKILLSIKETDLYYLDQSVIKNYIKGKGIQYCTGIQVSSNTNRQLRNNTINETLSGTNAIASFIKDLQEAEGVKEKLLKYANQIIDEVEGK